jgi:glycosyltransferase involved in cell wall biosynthesis
MKFSVLIAAYEAAPFVMRALESVRNQQDKEWEVVVVEDGSRDGTEELVREFASSVSQPVKYENLGTHRGVATVRNRLVELAEGEFLGFLDADDWWSPIHLTGMRDALNGGAEAAVARVHIYDLGTKQIRGTYVPPDRLFEEPVIALFEESCIMTSSSVVLRRRVLDQIGPFDPGFHIGEDRDYWLRCAIGGYRFVDSGAISCTYVKHSGSAMSKTLLWAREEVAFYEKHQGLVGVPLELRRDRLVLCLENLGRLLRASNPAASTLAFWRAWKLQPLRTSLLPHLFFSAATAALRPIVVTSPIKA